MKLSLLISMYNEVDIVNRTIKKSADYVAAMGIVRSTNDPGSLKQLIVEGPNVVCEPDISGRFHPKEIPAISVTRNYSRLFSLVKNAKVDYHIAITGDTHLIHLHGVRSIIDKMEETGCLLGVSKAIGAVFNQPHITEREIGILSDSNIEYRAKVEALGVQPNEFWPLARAEHLADQEKLLPGYGRKQTLEVADFMPQFFIVSHKLVKKGAFTDIQVTNRWCTEQCLGDEAMKYMPDWKKKIHVFSTVAYGNGFSDGVIYHVNRVKHVKA